MSHVGDFLVEVTDNSITVNLSIDEYDDMIVIMEAQKRPSQPKMLE